MKLICRVAGPEPSPYFDLAEGAGWQNMTRLELLLGLCHDPRCGGALTSAQLPGTTLRIVRRVAGDMPTAAEEKDFFLPGCLATLGQELRRTAAPNKGRFFCRD